MTPQTNQPSADVPEDVKRLAENAALTWPLSSREAVYDDIVQALLTDRQAREEARDGGGWRVKTLDWEDGFASTVFGGYATDQNDDGTWFFSWTVYPYGDRDDRAFATEDEAKAAAQADYEARIRSAIEPSPVEGNRR